MTVRPGFVGLFVVLLVWPACCFAQAGEGSYRQIVCTQYSFNDPAIPAGILTSLRQPGETAFQDARGTEWQATSTGLVETVAGSNEQRLLTGKDGLPIEALNSVAGGPEGRLWLATNQGAILLQPAGATRERWFYFAGRRYLQDDDVLKIVAVDDGAWVRTRTGISFLGFEPYTLQQKSDLFLKRVQRNHNRYGYVAPVQLTRPGDPDSVRMRPDDNDGLWTSMYVASECFRYADTGSAEALGNARASLAAVLRLTTITGIPGFPARSLMRRGDYREPDGEWHFTADGQWEWKGDTSSDELVGHFFAYWVAYHLLPDETDRAPIRKAVAEIAGGLIDHQWRLIGYGGQVTTWGKYDPAYLHSEDGYGQALDALELLSHLHVAYEITGEARFLAAYQQVGLQLGYLDMIGRFNNDHPSDINYSDEELGFLSFYPLLSFETGPALPSQYRLALTKLFQLVRPERNPLWNIMYAQGMGTADTEQAATIDSLQRIPLSTINWTVRNSQRKDLAHAPGLDRFGLAQAAVALSPNERRVIKWNGNPFQLDGGDGGRSEEEGVFFLLPYWMGRYYHLIDATTVTVGRIAAISHRGEHLHHPENTLPAYQAAIDAGADYFEVDVRTTTDGKLVLMHDNRVDRMTDGKGLVKDMTFAQIRALDAGTKFSPEFAGTRVPTFDEALALAQGKIGVYVDTKVADPQALVDAIVAHNMQDHVVIYGEPALLAAVRKIRPTLKVMPEAENEGTCRQLVKDLQPQVLAFDAADFKPDVIACARDEKARIYVDRMGTTDNPAGWQEAIDMGANGIQTDRPAELVEYLRGRNMTTQ
jgi:glycerophosphoryl diester phosphodiesterase